MSDAVEDYLLLALRLGRHVEGLVDFYHGPPALASRVAGEPVREPRRLVDDGLALLERLDRERASAWLAEQARGLHTYARVLAGDDLSYADEVEGCYGVRPSLVPDDAFAEAHASLDALLPGDGPTAERYAAWRETQTVPVAAVPGLVEAVVPILRAHTQAIVPLPAGEGFSVEVVTDEPWAAFNYYLGGRRSRVAVNVDLPQVIGFTLELVAHEGYPGHHTERILKESLLVEGQGLLEESIGPVPTPQAVVSEGIARLAQQAAFEDEVLDAATGVLAGHGVVLDRDRTLPVTRAIEPLEHVLANVALLIHEQGLSQDDAVAYCRRWDLRSEARARAIVRFVTDPTWRAYVTTYTEGARLCRAYVARHPADGFRRLLSEQVPVSELRAIAGDR